MSEYELPEPGQYIGIPQRVYTGKSEAKGTPYIAVDWKITTFVDPEEGEVEIEEMSRDTRFYVSGGAVEISARALDKLGLEIDPLFEALERARQEKGEPCVTAADAGMPQEILNGFTLVCEHEYYNGAAKESWDIDASGGPQAEVLSDDTWEELRSAAGALKSEDSGAAAQENGTQASGGTQTKAAAEDEDGEDDEMDVDKDEIPF